MVNEDNWNNIHEKLENPSTKQSETNENSQKNEILCTPRFRSVAAMAGWDEEALLIASLIVEDTPNRHFKHKKKVFIITFFEHVLLSMYTVEAEENRDGEVKTKGSSVIPCIDKLLSCAICYEPSTTPCGHSFCKKCLRSAADKCGKKCPKCSNGRYCTINTVLWNTIQLLFPHEVEARKAASSSSASDSHEPQRQSPARTRHQNTRNRAFQALNSPESESTFPTRTRNRNTQNRVVEALNRGPERINQRVRNRSSRPSGILNSSTRRELPSQDDDAALALRLQREEFVEHRDVSTCNLVPKLAHFCDSFQCRSWMKYNNTELFGT